MPPIKRSELNYAPFMRGFSPPATHVPKSQHNSLSAAMPDDRFRPTAVVHDNSFCGPETIVRVRNRHLQFLYCLCRQLEGIAKAKAEGKYRGGIPTARAKAEQVFAMVEAGKTHQQAADELGISLRSVYRILADDR